MLSKYHFHILSIFFDSVKTGSPSSLMNGWLLSAGDKSGKVCEIEVKEIKEKTEKEERPGNATLDNVSYRAYNCIQTPVVNLST